MDKKQDYELDYAQAKFPRGKFWRARRIASRLRLVELAEGVRSSASHLSHIETGKRRPSYELALEVARFYSCNIELLLPPRPRQDNTKRDRS
jgi:transcriptional regulator with XRE-family HTH domain